MLNQLLCKVLATATVLISATSLTTEIAQAGQQNFRVHNRTRAIMTRLFVTPSDVGRWGQDVLGDSAISSGYYDTILFPPGVPSCYFDMRAEFNNGYYLEYYDVNLCQVADVYFP